MGMQLNIKDEAIVLKARHWAKQDGESVTATVRAVFERESQRREADRAERLARMTKWADAVYAALPPEVKGMTSKEIMDSIYDENEPDGFAR